MSDVAPPPQLGRQVAIASLFMIGLRFAFRGIGFISTLVLVRLLDPADFGLVGLATAVFAMFDTLTEMSMQMALIRLPEMDRAHMDTAWTLGILRGVIIGAALAASAGLAADWMQDSRVTPIVLVLAAMAVVQGFENIGTTYFRRDLDFGMVFRYRLAGRLIAFAVTVGGAIAFRSYWALVAGIVGSRLFMVAYSYVIQPYRPRISFAALHELLHFSKWFLATNVLGAIEAYTATMLFGRIGGATAVGLYQISWQVGSLPIGEIAAPIREPLYSGYAKLLGSLSAIRAHFVEGLALVLLVVAPMSVGLGVTADLVWPIVLGAKWAASSPLIGLCAWYALFDSIGHFTHGIYIVLNRQRRLVLTYAPIIVVRFGAAIVIGLHWGVVAAVWSLTVTAALSMIIWVGCVLPILQLRLRDLLEPIWRTVVSCGVMAGVLLEWLPLTSDGAPLRVVGTRLAIAIGVGAASQIATQVALWMVCGMPAGPEHRVVQIAAGLWRRAVAMPLATRRWLQVR
ncbi:MAG TPA: oligosaccharide flippase family protein [Acetobacteraceae bacterium]|jgi:O-antigen/teichoic acid export membrane protein